MTRSAWIVLVASCLALGAPAAAQSEVAASGNPHGPLPDACDACHRPDAWRPARIDKSFDHGRFSFKLDGAHKQADCRSCHLSLVFSETPTACVSCHQDPHDGELGDDCGRCHTPRSFIDRIRMARAHQTTRFPLEGAHLTTDCDACHSRQKGTLVYVNLPSQCADCHIQDFLATTDPDHQAAGFSTDCRSCHTQVAFRPALFTQHDALYFPIYSGVHRGTWSQCSTCHINPSNHAQFSCFVGCHTHANQTEVTNQHAGVPGFAYDSDACWGCHPRGHV